MISNAFTLKLLKRTDWVLGELASFQFQIADRRIKFLSGQFISLHLDKVKRHYSLASDPENDILEFACSYIKGGVASEKLFNLQLGMELLASGPYGKFLFRDIEAKRYILIATGTGISPYRSMLPILQQKLAMGAEIILLFSGRTKAHALYFEDFQKFAHDNAGFKYLVYCSREKNNAPYYYGHVQDHLEQLNINSDDVIYLCGNPNMVDDVYIKIQALGAQTDRIFREKYVVSRQGFLQS